MPSKVCSLRLLTKTFVIGLGSENQSSSLCLTDREEPAREKMMAYYAALDVGLRTTAVCIVDGDGEIQLEKSLPSEVDDIVTCLRGFGAEIASVGLEAGTLTRPMVCAPVTHAVMTTNDGNTELDNDTRLEKRTFHRTGAQWQSSVLNWRPVMSRYH